MSKKVLEKKKIIKTISGGIGKSVSDLSEKHFSRYGEFLVSFELSKHGWNIYSPVYDEYIDTIIHKYVCKRCGNLWNHTPQLICRSCKKDFSKSLKKDIIAKKICKNCGKEMIGNKTRCINCKNQILVNKPTCNDCNGEVIIIKHKCECGTSEYITKFRTIQVKSSRLEINSKTGKSKNTYAIDMKPKDLIGDNIHFFIWCLIDNEDRPHFLVMSVNDFIGTMGVSLNGISFLKDQDRQHFNSIPSVL